MPVIVIRLDPGKLANPDADLRYEIPDLLIARSDGVLEDNGYDYESEGDAMQIYLRATDLDVGLALVIQLLEEEPLHGNRLAAGASVGVSDTTDPTASRFRVVYPPGVTGVIETPA